MNIPIIRVEVLVRDAVREHKKESKLYKIGYPNRVAYLEGRRDALRDLLKEARQKKERRS